MRISSFLPAVLALTYFSTSQAHQVSSEPVSALLAAGHIQAAAEVCAEIKAYLCADIEVKVKANVKAAGLISIDVPDTKVLVSARTALHTKVKTEIEAYVDVVVKKEVLDHIPTIVDHAIEKVCGLGDNSACVHKNAAKIAADINAKIDTKIKIFVRTIRAHVEAHLRVRLNVLIDELCVDLGILKATISAKVRIASNVDVKACIKAWAAVLIKLNLNLSAVVNALLAL